MGTGKWVQDGKGEEHVRKSIEKVKLINLMHCLCNKNQSTSLLAFLYDDEKTLR